MNQQRQEMIVEFLVEFDVDVPSSASESEVEDREKAEASAAAKLVDDGHLVRVWKAHVTPGETKVIGLYRATSETDLHELLAALPLFEWMRISVTPLERHPNDPEPARAPA